MANWEDMDIAAAAKTLSEDPESKMGGSGSKPKENGDGSSDVREEDDGLKDDGIESEGESKDGDGSWVDSGQGKRTRFKHLDGNGVDGLSMDVDGDRKGERGTEKSNDQDYTFRVGDLVWGKIRSHPWWPGQVCDPKDASEFAIEHKQEGRLLVTFFGDGTWSWCLPSQLIPFVENFSEMVTNGGSKSFSNAVESAVNEVGRLVELEMTCNCVPQEKRAGLGRPALENAGLKAGALMAEVDFSRLSIPEYESAELLEKVKELAKGGSVGSSLDLVVFMSWLSAFYYFKGGYKLPLYHEPLLVEGLEDKSENGNEVPNDDFSVPIEVPILGPRDDDWLASSTVGTVTTQAVSDNKTVPKRKQKSVAELMGDNKNVKAESRKRATVKEGADFKKSTSSQKKKKKNDGEVEGATSIGKTARKRKVEVSESPKITEPKVSNEENAAPSLGKPEEIEVVGAENTSGEAKEEPELVLSPRERKKSKYLSPPFTNLTWRIGNSSFKRESEVEQDKTTKTPTAEASGDKISTHQPDSKSVDKVSDGKPTTNGGVESVDVSVDTSENDKKMTFPVSDVDAPVSELLSDIELAAVDPLHMSKKGSLDTVCGFVSALRSSTYLHGPDYKIFRKCTTGGGKRKTRTSEVGDDVMRKKAKSSDQRTPKALTAVRKSDECKTKSKKAAEASDSKTTVDKGETLLCLILTFNPGFPLPSKEDIVSQFAKFGSLNKKETKVVKESHWVQIVYKKDSDAEAAFKSSLSENPYGSENVSFSLQRSSPKSRSHKSKDCSSLQPVHDKRDSPHDGAAEDDDLISDVNVVRQKLEIMTAILENYHSKFSPEDKCSLKDEVKQLLEKVEITSDKVRVMAENTSS